jgi:predicted CXXCH cytochrome family protein
MLFAMQVSSTPNFCGTCHVMKPYYQSWKDSKHNGIACVECHIPPGITAEFRKKYEALSMVVRYFTGTYGTNPWTEVDDAACLRCHERRLLEGKEVFHSVVFDHTPHLTESRRGLKLRCTSCHSQIVQGSHISVTTSTCALCHFKGEKPNEGPGRCLTCHEIPERVVSTAGVTFDHGQVRRLDMSCSLCHGGVVRGQGNVPRERCLTCHNEPERLAAYPQAQLLHRKHVAEHKVDCMNCHLQIEHGRPPAPAVASAEAGGCASCHGPGHSPQQNLYAGVGGRGVPRMPGPMYSAGVTCEGCHSAALSTQVAASGMVGVHSIKASDVSCMSCHGPGYRKIYLAWKQGLESRTGALREQLDASVAAMGISPPQAWEDARHNFLLVERGRGIHNVNFAYALLEKAHEQMNAARRARGLAPLALPWPSLAAGAGSCLACHQGVENQSGRFADRVFPHGPHVTAAKLECTTCHRPHAERAPGEVVRFGKNGCMPCHHRSAEVDAPACLKCHGDVTGRTVASFRGEFSHKSHLEAGLECGTCHTPRNGDPRPEKATCAQCHEGG